MRGLSDQSAFSRNAHSGQWIIPRDHPACHMCSSEGLDDGGCSWFEFVLEDDQTEKLETRFRLLPTQSINNSPKSDLTA
jgi:hypothetical protein